MSETEVQNQGTEQTPEPVLAPEDTVEGILRRRPKIMFRGGGLVEDTAKTESEVETSQGEPVAPETEEPVKVPLEVAQEKEPGAEEEKPPKYASMEEYEKARKEAERKMHEATTEAAALRKAREEAEKLAEERSAELEKIKNELAEATKPKPLTDDERDDIFAQALGDIADLDTDEPDYRKKAGRIWRTAMEQAGQSRNMPSVDDVAEATWKRFQDLRAQEEAKNVEDRRQEEAERTRQRVTELAAQQGLNMTKREDGRYHLDHRLFWDIAQEIPARMPGFKEGETPLEEQVKWVANEVVLERGEAVQVSAAEKEKQRKLQQQQQVLGRGGSPPPVRAPAEEESIASAMQRQKEALRIRR